MKINKRFQDYIDKMNHWNGIFGKDEMTFPLSQSDVDALGGKLSNELSPENLYCDGEISRSQAQRKYNKLMNVVKDLNAYAKKNGLNEPRIYY